MGNSGQHPRTIFGIALLTMIGLNPPSRGADPPTVAPAAAASSSDAPSAGLAFAITCNPAVHATPLKARVYVMLGGDRATAEPRNGPNWFRPEPFFAADVDNWNPGDAVEIDAKADGFPGGLDELKPGRYSIQAVVRLNLDTHKIGSGAGNLYGPVIHAALDPKKGGTVALTVDHVVPSRKFPETDLVKLVEIDSPMLSAFHHRPKKHRAAVVLPQAMKDGAAKNKVPTLYIIPGFGGDHFMASRMVSSARANYAGDFIRVVLDPDCGTGHHVFADSATNGPCGKALVEELIPYIEHKFPAIALPKARLLNGHSSGGWSSLWLQVSFPDYFGGTWSTSPDPVDFRDFQQINLYASGENMFKDREAKQRPIARAGAQPVLFYDTFTKMDDVIGWGGQLGSFEACFSPLDQSGRPRKLWNRATGAIDSEVAKAWEVYDIRLLLERNWTSLGPKLKGKLHVITGGMDTFYLEGAVKLLKDSLASLGSDATVEIIPEKDHGTVLTSKLAERLDREMHEAAGIPYACKTPEGH